MARRSNQTSVGGIGNQFDDAPVSNGGIGGDQIGAIDPNGTENGLPTVNANGNSADSSDGNGYGINRDGTPAKKRGRKPGQRNGSAQKNSPVSVGGVEKTLIAIHSGLAAMLHDPAWNLSDEEAKTFAEASTNVARHYNATLNPKIADWCVLIGVIAAMYGTRLIPVFMRLIGKKPRENAPTTETDSNSFSVNLPPIGGLPMRH